MPGEIAYRSNREYLESDQKRNLELHVVWLGRQRSTLGEFDLRVSFNRPVLSECLPTIPRKSCRLECPQIQIGKSEHRLSVSRSACPLEA